MSTEEIVEEESKDNEVSRPQEDAYYHIEKRDGFFMKYRNKEEKDTINVWNFHRSPIMNRSGDGDGVGDGDGEPKYTYETCRDFGQQFAVVEDDQIIKYYECGRMGANLSNKENLNLFQEITAPTMFFHNNFDKKKFFHIFSKFHQIPFFNQQKVDEMKKQCEEVRDQLIENKKKALIKLEKVIDEQIRLFETDVIGKLDKRKELINNVDVNQLEDKVKRGDVTLLSSEKTTPLTDIIMECGDVLTVIFSFLYARELIKNFTPACSMFLHMIHAMPLKIEIDERDLHLFEMQELLSEYKLQEIILTVASRSDRTNEERGISDPFGDKKRIEDFSKILTDRKHQIRHLDVEYMICLPFDHWNKQKPLIHEEGSLHFYDIMNECERLETLKTNRFIPKSMSKLTNLKKFVFHTPDSLSKRDADSLIEFFSDSDGGRYNLSHVEILVETESQSYHSNTPKIDRKKLLERYKLRELILKRISETCINLKSLVLDLEYCFHTFDHSLIEFIVTQVKDVTLIYGGFDRGLIVTPEIGELIRSNYGENAEDMKRGEGIEKINSILAKEVLLSKPKMDLFHDLLMTKRKKESDQSFKITSIPRSGIKFLSNFLTGGDGGDDIIEEKSLHEFIFIFEIMRLPHIEHELEFFSWQGTPLDEFIEIMSLKEFEGSDILSKSLTFKNLLYEKYKESNNWGSNPSGSGWGNFNPNNPTGTEDEERKKLEEKRNKEIQKFNDTSKQFRKCLEDIFSRSIFLEKLQMEFNLNLSDMKDEIEMRKVVILPAHDNFDGQGLWNLGNNWGHGGWGSGNNSNLQVMEEADVPSMKVYSFLFPDLMKSLARILTVSSDSDGGTSKLKILEVKIDFRNIRNHFNIFKVTMSEIFSSLELVMNKIINSDNKSNFEMLKISIQGNDDIVKGWNNDREIIDNLDLMKRKVKDLNEFFRKLCTGFVDSQNMNNNFQGRKMTGFKLLFDINISEKWKIHLGVVDNDFCVKKMDLVVYEDEE